MTDSRFIVELKRPSMLEKLRAVAKVVSRPALVKSLLATAATGYLRDTGWARSVLAGTAVDQDGEPLPWVTLPFIDFIAGRLTTAMTVFEFGSGSSTAFFARHAAEVFSVEHDASWFERVQRGAPANVHLSLTELDYGGQYCKAAAATGRTFDVIIVDGRDRVRCALNAVASLSTAGCIVLDDSERASYAEVAAGLRERGFKALDFWGLAPGLTYKKCTSVYYRGDNCLGI